MAIEVQLTLKCDRCDATCMAMAPLEGRKAGRLRVNASSASLPDGWWVGLCSEGFGYGEGVCCGCPKHSKEMRGY
jgi:hypothetical protein